MAPSFAELKAKAAKAKDAGVSKIQNTKDRHTSVPMAKTNWDPYSKQPPPPPPPPRVSARTRLTDTFLPPPPAPNRPSTTLLPPPTRGILPPTRSPVPAPPTPPRHTSPSFAPPTPPRHASPSSAPPPIIHSTRPGILARQAEKDDDLEIDWANLSAEDKQVFFSWLDEFFGKFFNITVAPQDAGNPVRDPYGARQLPLASDFRFDDDG